MPGRAPWHPERIVTAMILDPSGSRVKPLRSLIAGETQQFSYSETSRSNFFLAIRQELFCNSASPDVACDKKLGQFRTIHHYEAEYAALIGNMKHIRRCAV